jgi:hypothetical protein
MHTFSVRRAMAIAAVVSAAGVGTALAAGPGTVAVTLTPDRVSKPTTLHLFAQGPFPGADGAPTAVVVDVQRGFKADPGAVSTLCTPAQATANSCPAASQIGHGTVKAHVTTSLPLGFGSGDYDIAVKGFLAGAQQAGDLAGVVLQATVQTPTGVQNLSTIGRLLRPSAGPYGLELRFDKFPQIQPPAGVTLTVTVTQIELFAGASRRVKVAKGKKRRTFTSALITNPAKCTGTWRGKVSATFTAGSLSRIVTTPCRKH